MKTSENDYETADDFQEQVKCRLSFSEFVKEFWSVLYPGIDLKWSHCFETCCTALQEISEGRWKKLMILMPPGSGKTSLLVLWNAWDLIDSPEIKSLDLSYDSRLSDRDFDYLSMITKSSKYVSMFGTKILKNRVYCCVNSCLAGRRFNRLVIQDPVSSEYINDKLKHESFINLYNNYFKFKLDVKNNSTVIMSSRLHENDFPGHILKKEANEWKVITFPMEDEKGNFLYLTKEAVDQIKKMVGISDFDTIWNQRPHCADAPESWRDRDPLL